MLMYYRLTNSISHMYVIYLRRNFHRASPIASLINAIRPKVEENFRMAATLFFDILWKYCFKKIFKFSPEL